MKVKMVMLLGLLVFLLGSCATIPGGIPGGIGKDYKITNKVLFTESDEGDCIRYAKKYIKGHTFNSYEKNKKPFCALMLDDKVLQIKSEFKDGKFYTKYNIKKGKLPPISFIVVNNLDCIEYDDSLVKEKVAKRLLVKKDPFLPQYLAFLTPSCSNVIINFKNEKQKKWWANFKDKYFNHYLKTNYPCAKWGFLNSVLDVKRGFFYAYMSLSHPQETKNLFWGNVHNKNVDLFAPRMQIFTKNFNDLPKWQQTLFTTCYMSNRSTFRYLEPPFPF